MGPRSRELLGCADGRRPVERGLPVRDVTRDRPRLRVRSRRRAITYVGELGWELYVPIGRSRPTSTTRSSPRATRSVSATPATTRSTRCGSRRPIATGATTSATRTPRSRAASASPSAWDKPGGFIGRDALLRQRDAGSRRRLAVVRPSRTRSRCMYHNEPIWRDGVGSSGRISSATVRAHARPLDRSRLRAQRRRAGHRPSGSPRGLRAGGRDERFPAAVSLRSPYDPSNERIRS